MKAINIQRRRLMTSLALSALAAAPGASWAQTAAKALAPARGARIVVVGAGVGGATAAKYLKLFNKNLDVTLIDRNPNFIRHYGSSELITGAVTMEDLTVSYDALSDRYGVRVVRDTIVGLDADRRTVIGEKGRYAYDKLIVSPGIELLYEGIPGYSAELAATKIPSGWIAGPQTQLLADQLKAMPQGGTCCLVAPPNPYRCPPGPYERAALVTEWCAKHNPTAKIIVTDPKNNFVTDETMLLGWNRLYGFSIPADYKARLDKYASPARPDCRLEWVQEKQGGRPLAIDASAMTVTTEAGVIKADVINVIPPMRAANVALAMGLADKTGFCPIDRRTFESTIIPDVYVLGDASIADAMPKSGFSANTQAKTTARAIVEELAGREITEPVWSNTCYALAGEDYGLFVADVFRIMDGKIGRTNTRVPQGPACRAGPCRPVPAQLDEHDHRRQFRLIPEKNNESKTDDFERVRRPPDARLGRSLHARRTRQGRGFAPEGQRHGRIRRAQQAVLRLLPRSQRHCTHRQLAARRGPALRGHRQGAPRLPRRPTHGRRPGRDHDGCRQAPHRPADRRRLGALRDAPRPRRQNV